MKKSSLVLLIALALGCTATSADVPAPSIVDRITTGLPGWHRTSRAEVAARFPLRDGSRPQDYWRRWDDIDFDWTWPGDFDGDGEQDLLVLYTSDDDPRVSLLVAYHADGSVHQAARPGGWGVRVMEPGEQLRERAQPHGWRAGQQIVAVVYWEKGADLFFYDVEMEAYRPLLALD